MWGGIELIKLTSLTQEEMIPDKESGEDLEV